MKGRNPRSITGHKKMISRSYHLAALALAVASLSACGGGGDNSGTPVWGTPITAAPLVLSASTPSTVNGTLNKTVGTEESGISNATGTYVTGGPNDYCRFARYEVTNSGDGKKYDIEVVFAKSNKVVSHVSLALNGVVPPTFKVIAATPATGTAVDIANRRIGFTNAVLGTSGGNTTTLNGSLEYSTNSVVADRANCG